MRIVDCVASDAAVEILRRLTKVIDVDSDSLPKVKKIIESEIVIAFSGLIPETNPQDEENQKQTT